MKTFDHIFTPLKFGKLTSRNRIEVSPAEPFLCTKDGLITPEFIEFTAKMAKGGAGIVTIGDSPVTQEYADNNHYVVNLSDPFVVHGLVQLTEAIHRYGAIASIELNLRDDRLPADYSIYELKDIIRDFAESAKQCRKGGFDMVLLHGGHGHSVAQFFSPFFNKRTDKYGGSFENRCRFAEELLDAVRAAIGPDMAIEYRISGDELNPDGVHLDEALKFAKRIQSKIDMIHVSAGNLYDVTTIAYQIQPAYIPMATNVALAERFKKELDIPVTTVGSFNIELAEDAVASGKADMVAMIRAFIADPDQVNKAKGGRYDEICPCIRCCICTGDDPHGCPKPLRCTVNPIAGRDLDFKHWPKAEKPKKVLVVGGGAGGMEAARRLISRGHHPIIFERENTLGGTLIAAAANPLKSDIKRYLDWSVRMTEKTPGIEIHTGVTVTPELIRSEKPDAVIISVGSDQFIPHIPGIEGKNVCLAVDVDQGKAAVGRNVVLVGAGLTGTETAVALAKSGHEVTLIDMLTIDEIDSKGSASNLISGTLRGMAQQAGIKIITPVKASAVEPDGIIIEHNDGRSEKLLCDSVVLSMGVRPRSSIVNELSGIAPQTIVIGDCNHRAGNITTAVREAFFAAMDL